MRRVAFCINLVSSFYDSVRPECTQQKWLKLIIHMSNFHLFRVKYPLIQISLFWPKHGAKKEWFQIQSHSRNTLIGIIPNKIHNSHNCITSADFFPSYIIHNSSKGFYHFKRCEWNWPSKHTVEHVSENQLIQLFFPKLFHCVSHACITTDIISMVYQKFND